MKTRTLFAWAFAALAFAAMTIPAAAQTTHASMHSASYAAALQPIGLFAAPQGTVGFGDAYSFIAHHTDPATCVEGNVEFNLTSAMPKYCSAPNTWTPFASGGSGGGSVSSVSCSALSPLFGCSVANASTTPAISFSLSSVSANTVFGNFTGSSAAPSFGSLTAAMIPSSLTSSTSGNAATATALAATPSQCSGSQFAIGIAASGNANCATPAGGGTVNSGTQYAFGEYATSGAAISGGPTPPSANGEYFCGYSVAGSAAVAPSCWLNSLTPRAVTGTTSTDTILYSDSIVEYQGSVAVATALPTPATLGNSGFYLKLVNTTSGSATAVTVTAAGSFTFSSTGSGTLVIAQGQSCALLLDPAGSVWDDTCGDLPWSAGTNISIARSQFGSTLSVTNNAATVNGQTCTLGSSCTVTADLPSTPAQCPGSQFATGIAASGNANCSTPAGASFAPATATVFDDFMSSSSTSSLGFVTNGGGGSVTAQPTGTAQQFTNHPGIVELSSGGSSGGADWEYYILGTQNSPEINPTLNSYTIFADVMAGPSGIAFPNGTTRFGMFDNTSMNNQTPNSAVYFEAVNNGTTAQNWNCVVNTSGTPVSTSSGVTAAENTFNVLSIAFDATTTPVFFINGTQVCSGSSATIPSKLMNAAFEVTDNSSGAAQMLIDYFAATWNLTR